MIILYFLLVLIAVVLARTMMFKPVEKPQEQPEKIEFDGEAAIAALGELIKCRTVSYLDTADEDDAEFQKLIDTLPSLYPNVYKTLELKQLPDRALLYHWKGSEDGDPAVFMAHYDVVPVDEENWEKPPFEAIIEDGVMWGRGTLDTKVTFNGVLSAAENLIKQGFTPRQDIYFAFSGGEEVNKPGAINIMNYFKESGFNLRFVLDEGGAVVEDVFPGVSGQCGLIGIAEKGIMNVKYSISSDGGHSSSPKPHTPVGRLSAACTKIENHPFKRHFTKPVLEMFDTLGRHSTFLYRMIFANLWLFGSVLDAICKKSGGELNALVRTTVAFTQMEGGVVPNVIPTQATMVSNIRINPAESTEFVLDYLKKTIHDEDISIEPFVREEPSSISRTDSEGWNFIKNAVSATWDGALVSPYLMVACSDSKYYSGYCDKVYRFSAMDLTAEERGLIHGNNERIRLETAKRAVEFFIRVMKCC